MNYLTFPRTVGALALAVALLLNLSACRTAAPSSSDETVAIRAEVVGYGPVTLRDGTITQAAQLRIISPAALATNPRFLQVDLVADGGAPATHAQLRRIGQFVDFEVARAATSPIAFEVIPWNQVTVIPR